MKEYGYKALSKNFYCFTIRINNKEYSNNIDIMKIIHISNYKEEAIKCNADKNYLDKDNLWTVFRMKEDCIKFINILLNKQFTS